MDATIYKGYVFLRATQDTPQTTAHWLVEEVVESYRPHTSNWTFSGGGSGTISSKTVYFTRFNISARAIIPSSLQGTATGSPTSLQMDTSYPARFAPDSAAGDGAFYPIRNGLVSPNNYPNLPGLMRIQASGLTFLLKRDAFGNAWDAGTCGVSDQLYDDNVISYDTIGSL